MIINLANVLLEHELESINLQLTAGEFVSGATTAGWYARLVKNNTQLSSQAPAQENLQAMVKTALNRHELFQMAALPKTISPVLFSRYGPGMYYGLHVDNAIMGDSLPLRSDLAFTLFLNSPTSYGGGELVIETHQGEEAIKLDINQMVLYPASTLHRVEPVATGVRLAAIGWVQSLVRDASYREILFDLDTVRRTMFGKEGKTPEFDLLTKTHANLLRQWAEL
ncbi:Fe2+-dependent dioxygenase [Synechococcus sp. PCC 6312]|uniref:Fe2+-dependent dioxygenase n=1 Tax=Synechococcus sp. (strain ATCC 27167 / PCC 6312) TaxID=195253 RepID=UPI00029EFEB7|nr:Fe2+-dependent dioxygenase [Synechococcus sp. PCC 6312]AFY60494.1 putative iron-regulated protein [Synechococcus sp. PCC 6312]